MTTVNFTHGFTDVIPVFINVIPAQAGIHHQYTHWQVYCRPIVSMDSRLRGNDGTVQLPSVEEIEQELGGEL